MSTIQTIIKGKKTIKVAPNSLFLEKDNQKWQDMYTQVQSHKYQTGMKKYNQQNFRKILRCTPPSETPKLFLIQRQRTKPYIKDYKDSQGNIQNIIYFPASKGFSFQDLSSFVVGPIVQHGLNLVNAVWSKRVYVEHLEGGHFDTSKKDFWYQKRLRRIDVIGNNCIRVDGQEHILLDWMVHNIASWYPEWYKWSQSIALCGEPDFRRFRGSWGLIWCLVDTPQTIFEVDINNDRRLFVDGNGHWVTITVNEWKVWFDTYVTWLYNLWEQSPYYHIVKQTFQTHSIAIVHPMAHSAPDTEMTKDIIKDFVRNNNTFCTPWVLCAKLLDIPLEELYNYHE